MSRRRRAPLDARSMLSPIVCLLRGAERVSAPPPLHGLSLHRDPRQAHLPLRVPNPHRGGRSLPAILRLLSSSDSQNCSFRGRPSSRRGPGAHPPDQAAMGSRHKVASMRTEDRGSRAEHSVEGCHTEVDEPRAYGVLPRAASGHGAPEIDVSTSLSSRCVGACGGLPHVVPPCDGATPCITPLTEPLKAPFTTRNVPSVYRFTVKFLALLVPAKAATVTLTLPYFAFVGTLHVICVALHET